MMANVESFATGPMWAGFIAFVLIMLALDLFVFAGRKAHRVAVKEALAWVTAWFCLAFAFAEPPELQRRVLLYGVLGAIVMRAGMIHVMTTLTLFVSIFNLFTSLLHLFRFMNSNESARLPRRSSCGEYRTRPQQPLDFRGLFSELKHHE